MTNKSIYQSLMISVWLSLGIFSLGCQKQSVESSKPTVSSADMVYKPNLPNIDSSLPCQNENKELEGIYRKFSEGTQATFLKNREIAYQKLCDCLEKEKYSFPSAQAKTGKVYLAIAHKEGEYHADYKVISPERTNELRSLFSQCSHFSWGEIASGSEWILLEFYDEKNQLCDYAFVGSEGEIKASQYSHSMKDGLLEQKSLAHFDSLIHKIID